MKQIRLEDLIVCLKKLREGFSKELYPDFYVSMDNDRINFYTYNNGTDYSFPVAFILYGSLTDNHGQNICSCMTMFAEWKISTEPTK